MMDEEKQPLLWFCRVLTAAAVCRIAGAGGGTGSGCDTAGIGSVSE